MSNYFSCCHWNVNSIMTRNKSSLISAYNTTHKYDIICNSESYLYNTADNVLSIDSFNLIRATHPNNQTKGGVCMCFKQQSKLRQINTTYFSECILSEIKIGYEIGFGFCSTNQQHLQSLNTYNIYLQILS